MCLNFKLNNDLMKKLLSADVPTKEAAPEQAALPEKVVGPPRPSEDAPEEEWREYMSYYYTQEETTYCGVPVLTRPPPGELLVCYN